MNRTRTGLVALLTAEAVSTAGTRMSAIALPWLVLRATGDPARTGLVVLVEVLPMVVLQVLGAPLIDRLGAKRVSVVGNVGAGLALGCVPLLALADDLALGALLCCVFFAGLLRGPADSASQILVPAVAGDAHLPLERVTSLVDGAQRAASLLGAPVGAALIAAIGSSQVVALDATTFIAAAVLIGVAVPRSAGVTRDPAAVRAEGTAADIAGGPTDGYVAELRAGLVHLVRDRLLRSIAGMVLLTNLVDAGVSGLLLLVWARDRFGSATPVGLVGGVFGGGALLGALALTALGPRLPRRLTFGFAFVLAGAPRIAVLLLPVPLWAIALVWAACGFGAGAINPLLSAAEYERVPRDLQARVLGSLGAVAWAGIPFGALLAGLLVEAADLRTALVVAAVVYGLATLDPFLRPAWRLMDRRPIPSPDLAPAGRASGVPSG